jgi:hypothetical protein
MEYGVLEEFLEQKRKGTLKEQKPQLQALVYFTSTL